MDDQDGRVVARERVSKEQLTFTGDDTAMANLLLSVMGAFAEFERALIGERQREGIALARRRAAYKGRKTVAQRGADEGAAPTSKARAWPRRRWPVSSPSAGRRCTARLALVQVDEEGGGVVAEHTVVIENSVGELADGLGCVETSTGLC